MLPFSNLTFTPTKSNKFLIIQVLFSINLTYKYSLHSKFQVLYLFPCA